MNASLIQHHYAWIYCWLHIIKLIATVKQICPRQTSRTQPYCLLRWKELTTFTCNKLHDETL